MSDLKIFDKTMEVLLFTTNKTKNFIAIKP